MWLLCATAKLRQAKSESRAEPRRVMTRIGLVTTCLVTQAKIFASQNYKQERQQ